MMDAWSDRKRRSIMNLCVSSKIGTVFLSSKECSGEAHTSQHIYEYVESCIQQVGPENVVQVVTDNATNNMGATKLLKEKISSIFWTSCVTHTINLMLEGIGALPMFKKSLDQAKKLTIFIYAHHKTLVMMRSYTNKREIIRSGVTRFATAFLTLQSLSEKKEQLRHMFSSNEWEECKFSGKPKRIASYKTVTSVQFWSSVTQCLKVFSPLVKVLRMIDANWKPLMSFVYGEIKIAKEEIIKSLGGNEKHYKPIIDIINTKMKGRLDSTLHLTSYLLNPYYHYNDSQLQYDHDVHTKKRNRLETTNNSLSAQEWIVDCDECDVDEVDLKMVDDALATDVSQAPRESPRTKELLDEDFESESESEEQVLEEEEYESDGVQIMEVYKLI
ncbi:unnamed protein product [Lactuca virosa]|uniref:DUF659 domain-containing protein n=1 Tax=Lactuca virosa TaxID=75947 RepID=A0AAU9P014_9ASTR|nr:unnamed protein product [Lactuca virosa]